MDYEASETDSKQLKRLVIPKAFRETIEELKKLNIAIPFSPSNIELNFNNYIFPPNGELVSAIDEIKAVDLDPKEGSSILNEKWSITAYDESLNKFSALEGTAYLTSHSMVLMGKEDFLPVNLMTLYFYTRSKAITDKSQFIRYSEDPDMDSKKDYVKDKIKLLEEYVPDNSILLIDGPLIGGDVYTFMIAAIKKFSERGIIPIFFVKNSSSNLVTDNIPNLRYSFNTDMHWAYRWLNRGQRTNFFRYVDRNNPKNAKVFCYLKAFNLSPQRVEFHVDTYKQYEEFIPSLMNLVYYFLLVQGDMKNPQLRPIAIAEKYARETIKLVDINDLLRTVGLIPTMNEERGMVW